MTLPDNPRRVVRAVAVDPWPEVEVRFEDGSTDRWRPRWRDDGPAFEAALLARWPELTGAWADAAPATLQPIQPPRADPYRGLPELRQGSASAADVALMRLRAGPARPMRALARDAVLVSGHLYVRREGWARLELGELRVEHPEGVFVFGRRERVWMPWAGPVRDGLRERLRA